MDRRRFLKLSATAAAVPVIDALPVPKEPVAPLYEISLAHGGAGSGHVTSSPPGLDCGVDCSEVYRHGTQVELIADPDDGSRFVAWEGDPDCADGLLNMEGPRACTAVFDLCATPALVTVTDVDIDGPMLVEACNHIVVGPDCHLLPGARAVFRAGEDVTFLDSVSLAAGAELEVEIDG